jgi:hypothetical protein
VEFLRWGIATPRGDGYPKLWMVDTWRRGGLDYSALSGKQDGAVPGFVLVELDHLLTVGVGLRIFALCGDRVDCCYTQSSKVMADS